MMSDPISDMLSRIRNAIKAGLPSLELPGSRIKGEIAKVMKAEGYITDFTLTDTSPRVLSIELKYNDDAESAIRGLRRESKPGLRKFCGAQNIPNVLGGMGTAILSTSGGVISGKEAKERKLGGEVLCAIW
jgi:small subunit ribosomal protein S8